MSEPIDLLSDQWPPVFINTPTGTVDTPPNTEETIHYITPQSLKSHSNPIEPDLPTPSSYRSRTSRDSQVLRILPPPLSNYDSLKEWLSVEFAQYLHHDLEEFLYQTVGLDSLSTLTAFLDSMSAQDIIESYGKVKYDKLRYQLIDLRIIWSFTRTQYDPRMPARFTYEALLRYRGEQVLKVADTFPPSDVYRVTTPQIQDLTPPKYASVSPVVKSTPHFVHRFGGSSIQSWNMTPDSPPRDAPDFRTSQSYFATNPRMVVQADEDELWPPNELQSVASEQASRRRSQKDAQKQRSRAAYSATLFRKKYAQPSPQAHTNILARDIVKPARIPSAGAAIRHARTLI